MRRAALCLALLAILAPARGAEAGSITGSALALSLVAPGDVPSVVLMQRTITREWGPSDDSTYHEVVIPDWKSEAGAMVMSAIVPGAGQLYVGENSGWLFMAAEAAGLAAIYLFHSQANDIQKDVVAYAGSPFDSAATWSSQRWSAATGEDPAWINSLYEGDRNAYYQRIADDPVYGSGWRDPADDTRINFKQIRDHRERFLKRARGTESVLWINHVLAALDALRAARNHNRPLRQELKLRVGTRWGADGPALRAALERSF